MSRNNTSKDNSSNVNVTTYSGFSKLRFWSTILKLLLIPNFIIMGLVGSSLDSLETNLLNTVILFLVLIGFIAHIIALVVIAILRNAYRV
jgi:hypothetical protein